MYFKNIYSFYADFFCCCWVVLICRFNVTIRIFPPRCQSPKKVKDALILDMSEPDFECPEYDETALARSVQHHDAVVRSVSVGMAAGLLVVLALGLGVIFKWKAIKTWYKRSRRGPGAVYYVRARANPTQIAGS